MSWLKKNSSIVWEYFRKNPNAPNEASCTLCEKSYQRASGTSNLLEHLKRKHMPRLERDKMLKQNERHNDTNLPGTSESSQDHQQPSSFYLVSRVDSPTAITQTSTIRTDASTSSEPPIKRQKQLLLSNRFYQYPTGLET